MQGQALGDLASDDPGSMAYNELSGVKALAKQLKVAAPPCRGEECAVKTQLSQGCQMHQVWKRCHATAIKM